MSAARGDPAGIGAPVFIVGLARSGTSILYRLVQEHPRFRPADGLNLTESHLMDAILSGGPFDAHSLRGFAGMGAEEWLVLQQRLRPLDRRRRLASALPRRLLVGSVRTWAALGCAEVASIYLGAAATARGVRRLVEKTPNHVHWARHLLHAFPDAQLLAITRHPVPAYASFRRRAAEDHEARWADLSAGAFAERWTSEVDRLVQLGRRAGASFRIERYERLVEDPDRAQRALFRWLREEPLDELPGRVAANPHAPASEAVRLFGGIAPTGADWRDHLNEPEVVALEQVLARPMALLGYEPISR